MDGQLPAGGPLPGGDGALFSGSLGPGSASAPVPWLGQGAPPARIPEDDFNLDEHFAWLVREIDAGRVQAPPESLTEGPAISVSLGDACDVDPELLAAVCGPEGLGGQAVSAAFGQDSAADALGPGPVLAAVTAQAVSDTGSLTDNELIGVLQAARRLENQAAYQQTVVIAEFARRRQADFEAARAAGKPAGCRAGEFPGEELAMELVDTGAYAGARIDTAIELTARLPRTLAGMADGTIDLARACTIASRTRTMTDADAAYADEVLAAAAPGLRPDQLARKAAALEMKLAPEAVRARKELARQLDQRVEARREESGNASLSGRELDTADVIASKAHIDAIAVRLRNSGFIDGSLARLRALALVDLTQGRDPLDRIKPQPAAPALGDPQSAGESPADPSGYAPEAAADPADAPEPAVSPSADVRSGADPVGWGNWDDQLDESSPRPGRARPSDPTPAPALINLLVPVGTLLGWGTAPVQAAGWGLLDADEATALIQAAARHPRTRWCATVTAPDGTAIAHACGEGQHPWPPNAPAPPGAPPGTRTRRPHPGPPPRPASDDPGKASGRPPPRQAQLLDLLRRLNLTLEPIARDTCDHRHAEDRYVPSRKLKHLLRARNQTCTAPACNAQAQHCDIDHTIPYPDGPTDQCNTSPKCRRHHRTKQAPGWKTTQPTPDTATWTTPSGRTHTTTPTAYDL